jgi:hypothetical protein
LGLHYFVQEQSIVADSEAGRFQTPSREVQFPDNSLFVGAASRKSLGPSNENPTDELLA